MSFKDKNQNVLQTIYELLDDNLDSLEDLFGGDDREVKRDYGYDAEAEADPYDYYGEDVAEADPYDYYGEDVAEEAYDYDDYDDYDDYE